MLKIVLVLMLAGCSEMQLREVGESLKTAGGVTSSVPIPAVQNEPYRQQEQVDQQCRTDCFNRGYTWAYCTKQCSY